MSQLTIGKAAKQAGVRIPTIRFYERRGLIDQPPKPTSGYRTYPPESVACIRFIRQAQELGFSLREVKELLKLRAHPGSDAADVRTQATAKLEDVNGKIRRLEQIRNGLETLIAACPGQGTLTCCSIMEALEMHASANGEDADSETKRSQPI